MVLPGGTRPALHDRRMRKGPDPPALAVMKGRAYPTLYSGSLRPIDAETHSLHKLSLQHHTRDVRSLLCSCAFLYLISFWCWGTLTHLIFCICRSCTHPVAAVQSQSQLYTYSRRSSSFLLLWYGEFVIYRPEKLHSCAQLGWLELNCIIST